jgi:hypothetical protein
METIIGFTAGYLAGAREGRAGLARLKTSAQAILKSPEVRRLASEGLTIASGILRQASARGVSASASEVVGYVMRRASGTTAAGERD